jgi:hypothetical protein
MMSYQLAATEPIESGPSQRGDSTERSASNNAIAEA